MSYLSIIRAIDKCIGSVPLAISTIGRLDNEDFVAFIRESRDVEEAWWGETRWTDAVDREIRMRQLLLSGGSGGCVALD